MSNPHTSVILNPRKRFFEEIIRSRDVVLLYCIINQSVIIMVNLKYHAILFLGSNNLCSIARIAVAYSPNHRTFKVFYDSSHVHHRDLQYHPEQPARIKVCIDKIKSQSKQEMENQQLVEGRGRERRRTSIELINVSPPDLLSSSALLSNQQEDENRSNCNIVIVPKEQPFSQKYLLQAKKILNKIHSEEYVLSVEMKSKSCREKRIKDGKDPLGFIDYIDHDTFLTAESFDICLRATAIWMTCVDVVLNSISSSSSSLYISSRSSCMALTRPPGHHATKSLPNGFCLFNFAAAAATYALENSSSCTNVTIVDIDVHYGQGIADIIESNPNIRYISMHQVPAFPYLGQSRTIHGQYKNIYTIPVAAESTWTCGYESLFKEHVLPFVYNNNGSSSSSSSLWEPELIIVCAGYDALASDELASCNLNSNDYGTMIRLLREHIGHFDNNNHDADNNNGISSNEERKSVGLMIGLEGGYQLRDNVPGGNLADGVWETIKASLL